MAVRYKGYRLSFFLYRFGTSYENRCNLSRISAFLAGKFEIVVRTAHLFGVTFAKNESIKQQVLDNFIRWKAALTAKTENFAVLRDLLSEEGCHHYLVSRSVVEMVDKIRVKPPFDMDWLAPVADGKRQLNFDNRLIRYLKRGPEIMALSILATPTPSGQPYLNYSFFRMDLATNQMSATSVPDDYDPEPYQAPTAEDFDAASKKLFFQLITFMELAAVEEVVLPPGGKYGFRKAPDNLVNEEKFPITIVNTSWNKIIRREGFDVSGHLRKQACGPANTQRKLIWVDPFHKNGYNLNAKRLQSAQRRGRGL